MIGYYIHHHGLGHRTRALEIALRLRSAVVGFSSLSAPGGWPGEWVTLPSDETDAPHEPEANGVFHWAPLDHAGHRERLGVIASRLANDITAMVVDTSAEITLLSRLFGVRTVVLAMRGDRTDRAHLAAYDAASRLIVPWSAASGPEPGWPDRWASKTLFVGAISRFDGRTPPVVAHAEKTVLLVWGAGGTDATRTDIQEARAATPDWVWTVRSPSDPSPDLWHELAAADVVVSHAGANTVAEVAAARRPAIVIGQERPFNEQLGTVSALRHLNCCVALEEWPPADRWPTLLQDAATFTGKEWSRWLSGGGAAEAASLIDRMSLEAE